MRIGEISGASSRQTGLTPRDAGPGAVGPAPASRELVAVKPAAATQRSSAAYRQAPFLAHLIAMKGHHPQTRERRRAEPNEALAAYRAVAALEGRG